MATMKMRDVKVGEAIMYNGEVWVVFDRHEQTRGNLRTYWQIKLKHLDRGNVVEQRFSPDDNVEKIILNPPSPALPSGIICPNNPHVAGQGQSVSNDYYYLRSSSCY